MSSSQSISFRKRDEVDEIYTFPFEVNQATLQIRNAVVMIDHQDDDTVQIIVGNLPEMGGFVDNYPDVEGGGKQQRHEFAQKLLSKAEDYLDGYEPKRSFSTSNSGNQTLRDLYVTVDEDERDRAVLKAWQMLNYMANEYEAFLRDSDEDDYYDYPSLEEEVVELSKDIQIEC